MTKSLPISPYNKDWYDCYLNGMLSVLIAHDESFNDLPTYIMSNYRIMFPRKSDMEPDRLQKVLSHGWGILCVKPVHQVFGLLDKYLSFETINLEKTTEVGPKIKELLLDNYYVQALVDRYYFPNGIDYHNRHVIHPSLFYGFNDEAKVYNILEDHVNYGYTAPYELPYMSFGESLNSLQETEVKRIFKISIRNKKFKNDPKIITSMLHEMLVERQENNSDSTIYYGFSGINYFINNFDEIIHSICTNTLHITTELRKIVRHQKRYAEIIRFFEKTGILSHSDALVLNKTFRELFEAWEIIINSIIKRILSGNNLSNSSRFSSSFSSYFKIIQEEKLFVEMLLDKVTR